MTAHLTDVMVDTILGLDFIQENYCIIDCGRSLITIPPKEFSLPRDDGSRYPKNHWISSNGWTRDGDNGNTNDGGRVKALVELNGAWSGINP